MYKITEKQHLNQAVCKMTIEEPDIAAHAKPGQFVVIRIDQAGERVPLTIFDKDPGKGTITIIFQAVGKTTLKLCRLEVGYQLSDVLGPLGRPTHIERFGSALCVGGGVGAAEVYPGAKALRAAGNKVTAIIGARTKGLLILEKELSEVSNKLYVTTDDGSYARRGFVTDVIKELLDVPGGKFDIVFAIGPVPMMRAVCDLTRQRGIKTVVSLNSNMIDATGMCGTCRVTVAGRTKFTCVDGPEFDGHLVDFDELTKRNNRFLKQEKEALELFRHKCHLDNL